jgi:hypothetical protein
MADITITVKGLTGRQIDITLSDATQLDGIPALIRAQEEESASLTDGMYGEVSLDTNPDINLANNGTDTLATLGFGGGEFLICHPAEGATREDRQVQKLEIAAAKREFLAKADYTYDLTQLPTKYSGDTVVDNPNSGGLLEGRPWA